MMSSVVCVFVQWTGVSHVLYDVTPACLWNCWWHICLHRWLFTQYFAFAIKIYLLCPILMWKWGWDLGIGNKGKQTSYLFCPLIQASVKIVHKLQTNFHFFQLFHPTNWTSFYTGHIFTQDAKQATAMMDLRRTILAHSLTKPDMSCQ